VSVCGLHGPTTPSAERKRERERRRDGAMWCGGGEAAGWD